LEHEQIRNIRGFRGVGVGLEVKDRTGLNISTNFLAQKPIGKKKIFSILLVSRNAFKRGNFSLFLASKIYDKIWHCLNIFCNFCVSENFGMSPVPGTVSLGA